MNDYPPIKNGTKVRTTSDLSLGNIEAGYTEETKLKRIPNKIGFVVGYHDSHGLCYDVQHEDKSVGTYEPYEVIVLPEEYKPAPYEDKDVYEGTYHFWQDYSLNHNPCRS